MKKKVLSGLVNAIISAIFCIAIFVPYSVGIFEEDQESSRIEKRNLSRLPEVPKNINELNAFPGLFDAYYSDHFGFRDWLVEYYKLVKFMLGDSPSEDVTIGKDGWLFLGSIKKGYTGYSDPIGDFRGGNLYSQEDLEETVKYMAGVKRWLKEKGIEYVFVIAPNKHTIYYDKLPSYIFKVDEHSATDQLVSYLDQYTDIPVVDLRDKLLEGKDRHQLYYKTDTHWNHFGANIAQYEVMLEIEKLFPGKLVPEMMKLSNDTRGGGDLAHFMGLHGFVDVDPKPVFGNSCMPKKEPPDAKLMETYTLVCETQEFNAVIFRDSFFTTLQPYFSRRFKRSTYIWSVLNFASLEKYIELESPDIVIEQWVERSLPLVPKDGHRFSGSPAH